jgi:aminopeptidase-like protein
MYKFAKKLWPINRSLTGAGVEKTLSLIKKELPIKILNFKSGSKVFDWRIPKVWEIKNAWLADEKNKKIIDFKKNNLHVVGYSKNINKKLTFKDLKNKIHYLKNQPTAIPYVTSYYKKDWGFCLEYNKFKRLKRGNYKAFIDSKFINGNLKIGELVIKGKSKKEILISTYLCHPSMANNEISGIVIATYLARWVKKKKNKYTYRFLFLPETIGSIAYLSKMKNLLMKNVIAGYVLTCIGDERNYSFLESKEKNSLSNIVAKFILKSKKNAKIFDWLKRGSDERQFCSPGIDLPVASIMRTKYGEYPEYHTSLDKIGKVVTKKGLNGSLKLVKKIIGEIEKQNFPVATNFCEPFLTKKNMYPTISKSGSVNNKIRKLLDFLSFCDGKNSVLQIQYFTKLNTSDVREIMRELTNKKLIKNKEYPF